MGMKMPLYTVFSTFVDLFKDQFARIKGHSARKTTQLTVPYTIISLMFVCRR